MLMLIIAIAITELIENTYFKILLLSFVCFFAFLLMDYNKNIFLICFLICFFVFLLGRPIAYEIFGLSKSHVYNINKTTRNYMYMCLTISLYSVIVGYHIKSKIKLKLYEHNNQESKRVFIESLNKVTKTLSIFTLIVLIIENIFRLIIIKRVGYTNSYALDFNYGLPYGLHYLAEVAPIAFSFFLATLPKKRNAILPIILFCASNLIMAISGNRFEIIAGGLLLLIYFLWRNAYNDETWISKKQIVLIIALIPFIVLILQYMIYWRSGNEIDTSINPFVNFLYGVGGSSDLIGVTYETRDLFLDSNTLYSFGNIWRSFNGNIISKLIGFGVSYKAQTPLNALYGHSLSAALTYALYPENYLAGYGLGGCYIAELLHDFSICGVVMGNLVLGIIIATFSSLKGNRVFNNFMSIYLITLLKTIIIN